MPGPNSSPARPGQTDTEVDPLTLKRVLRHSGEEDDAISSYEKVETALLAL